TTPDRLGIMCRSAARVQRSVPVSVTSMMRAHCSSVMSTISTVPPSPALFTTTSMRPWASIAAANSACTCSSSVTSHGTARGRSLPLPSARGVPASDAAVSARRRSWASLTTTVAPSASSRRAVAEPMPVPAAAVTTATLPASRSWPAGSAGGAGGEGGAVGRSVTGAPRRAAARRRWRWRWRRTGGSPGLLGEAERPLADDVALDLVGPGVDGVGPAEQEQAPQPVVLRFGGAVPDAGGGGGAEHVHGQLAQAPVERRPVELADHRRGPERAPLAAGEGAQGVEPHDLQRGVGPGQPLAHHRVAVDAGATGHRQDG